ncbi:MAG: 4Fe-4S dicluster domain-containing protein [Eubacterium sp.]|nr:4Fe-4S dicluster domain-containing protein [Eubacterium sp.]
MKIKVLRQKKQHTAPYWEGFDVDVTDDMTIAGVLDYINYNDDIIDDTGKKTSRIGWECSCLQGVCGACAMVINGVPAIACETMVKDLKGNEITIRPLQKFPVIHDLIVDRSIIYENLKKINMYIGEYTPAQNKKFKEQKKEHEHQYETAKCLKCGLCMEVCPNYVDGKNFFGALFANDCYLVSSRNQSKAKEVRKSYEEHFGKNCSKAFSCMTVCPMHIPTLASMAKMNRQNGPGR